MAAVGIDTHKATLAACVVDELGAPRAERTFANNPGGHAALAAWVDEHAAGATIGVEGSSSYGAGVARALAGRGFAVREVPPQLSRRSGPEPDGPARAIRAMLWPSPG